MTEPCESGPPWQLVDHRLFELSKVTASGVLSALKYPPEDSIATLAAGAPLAERLVPVNSEMLSDPRLGTHSPIELDAWARVSAVLVSAFAAGSGMDAAANKVTC